MIKQIVSTSTLKNVVKMLLISISILSTSALSALVLIKGDKMGLHRISGEEFFFAALKLLALGFLLFLSTIIAFGNYEEDGKPDLLFFAISTILFFAIVIMIITLSVKYVEFASVSISLIDAVIIAFLLARNSENKKNN